MKTYLITLHMEVEVPDKQTAARIANHLKHDAPMSILRVLSARSLKILDSTIVEKLAQAKDWPPLNNGTLVRTTKPNLGMRKEWTEEGWESRRWGVLGKIIRHHDSHGLCYEVWHADETVGFYDPSELEVIAQS